MFADSNGNILKFNEPIVKVLEKNLNNLANLYSFLMVLVQKLSFFNTNSEITLKTEKRQIFGSETYLIFT